MSTPPSTDRAARGRERLAARARRVSSLRRRVVAGALASFVLAWGVIAFDGSMGVPAQTTTTTTTASTHTATASTTRAATATATATPSQDTTPVTTAQS